MLDKLLAKPGAVAMLASVAIGAYLCLAGHPDYGTGLLLGAPTLWGLGVYFTRITFE